jgi:hypothetical protein
MILGMTGNQRASIHVILLKTSAGSRDPCYKMASADLEIPGRLHGGSLSKGVYFGLDSPLPVEGLEIHGRLHGGSLPRVYFDRIRHCRWKATYH